MTTVEQVRGRTAGGRGSVRRLVTAALGVAAAATALVAAPGAAEAMVPTSPCSATVHVDSAWGSTQSWAGTVLTVTVTNTASMPSTTWTATARMADGQSVGSIWNARSIGTGVSLVVRDANGNGALAAGASTTFGVYLSGGSQVPSFTCTSDAPAPPGGTVVTEADNGRTVTVVLGDTVTVDLGADWQPTVVTGDGLALVSLTGGYPTRSPLHAVYRSIRSSASTTLTSHTDYDCFHTSPPCAAPSQLWSVTVRVAVPPPTVQAPA